MGSRIIDVIHTQIEGRSAGGSVWVWYWCGRSRVVDVADLVRKELVKLWCIDTVVFLSLFGPGWSKTSCIGDGVELAAFDEKAKCGGPGLETGPLA